MAPADVVVGLLVVGALIGLAVLCGSLALRLARRGEQSDVHRGARAAPGRSPGAGTRLLDELRAGSMRIAMARLPLPGSRATGGRNTVNRPARPSGELTESGLDRLPPGPRSEHPDMPGTDQSPARRSR